MYCASPSGLRQWSWDNDTASARLQAMGDVPWGKVGAGALHYNADGRQVKPQAYHSEGFGAAALHRLAPEDVGMPPLGAWC